MKRMAYLGSVLGALVLSGCGEAKQNAASQPITCEDKVVQKGFGFNENVEASTCEMMKVFDMQDYQCSVQQNVFGTSQSAAHLTTDSKSVYAFSTPEQCIDALKKWIEIVP